MADEGPKNPRSTQSMATGLESRRAMAVHDQPVDERTTMMQSPLVGTAPKFAPKGTVIEPRNETARTSVWVATHQVPAELDDRLILLSDPDSAEAAAFRVLRQRLAERGDPRSIVVTSPGTKEGKTTVAANLALALGECGRAKVLLIEANFRTPALASLFGFIPPECFGTQLERHREKPLDPWSVVEVFSPFLHVLAVHPHTASRPLVDAPAFSTAMDRFRVSGYDYLVLDTPAVIGQADVNLVEDTCDGVLLTGVSGQATARQLARAVEQLSPAKIVGFTLIDT